MNTCVVLLVGVLSVVYARVDLEIRDCGMNLLRETLI